MRMSGGNEKEPLATIKKINCACLPHASRCLPVTSKVQGSGRGPTRLIRLVRRVPPTTDGTRLKTAWSLTSALLESLAATATDDGDSVGA